MKFIIEIDDDLIEDTIMGDEFPLSSAEEVLYWKTQYWNTNKIKVLRVYHNYEQSQDSSRSSTEN